MQAVPSRSRAVHPRLLAIGVILLAGCTGWGSPIAESPTTAQASPSQSPTPSSPATTTPSRPPALDQSLYGLVTAENRTAYADQQSLVYENGSVQVVIKVASGRSLPTDLAVDVELRSGSRIQGSVAVDDLIGLARHENVTTVKPPTRPQAT